MIYARLAVIAATLALTAAACGGRAELREGEDKVLVPDLSGFDRMPLSAIEPPLAAGTPVGMFSYRLVDSTLDWYLIATQLKGGRAYRVVLVAADGVEYAVASERTALDGSLTAHGVETVLMNRECVGIDEASRRPLPSARTLSVMLKLDGSKYGSFGNDIVGSGARPCHGNGDDDFAYVLRAGRSFSVGP